MEQSEADLNSLLQTSTLQFTKETKEHSLNEEAYFDKQIEQLQPFTTTIHANNVLIQYSLTMTMIDGKVCNAITNTKSAQRCYLCQGTSKQFNNINEVLKRPVTTDYLQYGLSSLHAWIRCFECCIHLGYTKNIKKWQARKEEDKEERATMKARIQTEFKEKLGILVDMPKQGFGSTNDGNTARRFFENTKTSSLITGVSEELISRFHIILQTISSGRDIDVEKFRVYALATARHYVKEYPWYNMPTSVHRLLIHGPEIISSAILPIGQLSEDAQESTNKLIKQNRLSFSRKISRVTNIEDVFRRLLATTDPFISTHRKPATKKLKSLLPDAVALLVPVAEGCEDSDDEETDIEDQDLEETTNEEHEDTDD